MPPEYIIGYVMLGLYHTAMASSLTVTSAGG